MIAGQTAIPQTSRYNYIILSTLTSLSLFVSMGVETQASRSRLDDLVRAAWEVLST